MVLALKSLCAASPRSYDSCNAKLALWKGAHIVIPFPEIKRFLAFRNIEGYLTEVLVFTLHIHVVLFWDYKSVWLRHQLTLNEAFFTTYKTQLFVLCRYGK